MLEQNMAETPESTGPISKGAFREFAIDFIGGLVPGIAFLVTALPVLVLPLLLVVVAVFGLEFTDLRVLWSDKPLPVSTVMFLVVPGGVAFLIVAYICGHVFYRQNPKMADEASFRRIPRHIHHDGMVRPVQGGDSPVEFPYHGLRLYLEDRGILYLAALIPWDTGNFRRRAKHFANALKIRIQISSPASYSIVARNEAHVRLSSSMWYVCRFLMWCGVIGVGTYFVTIISIILITGQRNGVSPWIVLSLMTILVVWLLRRAIEFALHYQREREVLFILETAYWLQETKVAPDIFLGLAPPVDNPAAQQGAAADDRPQAGDRG